MCNDDSEVKVAEEAQTEHVDETCDKAVAAEVTIAADHPNPSELNNFECYFCDLDCISEEKLEIHWHEKHGSSVKYATPNLRCRPVEKTQKVQP